METTMSEKISDSLSLHTSSLNGHSHSVSVQNGSSHGHEGDNKISESDVIVKGVAKSVPVLGEDMHNRIVSAFTAAFRKQNTHFEKAIESLDALNDQIITFAFSPEAESFRRELSNKSGDVKYRDAFRSSINLMRKLLLEAQVKFQKMVEENKALAGRLDGDLQSAHQQMAILRAELNDTNQRISQISSPPSSPSTPSHHDPQNRPWNGYTDKSSGQVNGVGSGSNGYSTTTDECNDPVSLPVLNLDGLSQTELRHECEKLISQNQGLQKELVEMRQRKEGQSGDSAYKQLQTDFQNAKDALSALKGDRKRLKAEKFELLNQMKQLYTTLEDKEKELRDFIRNYEQRVKESEASLQRVVVERDEAERERWSILRHARDEAERGLSLAAQLTVRESQVQQIQQELMEAKRQLSQFGIYSEPERPASTTATGHYAVASSLNSATYASVGDRGSSADSGVRLSSERDSAGGLLATGNLSDSPNEALSVDLGDGSGGDGDTMSVISTATLPQLFATPRDSPGPLSYSALNRSGLHASTLSRSAEQLLAAEAAEARRKNSRRLAGFDNLTGRASNSAKGAWGSISRVFARNKHRRALDPSLYEGQRTSWSPQSSVPQSPMAEQESYADKLRALEEAATLPMELWRAGMVQAWIEVSLGMPQYGLRCADNIKSGKVLLELSDAELETELGISHPLHRKKLRLAIEEHRNPALVRFPCIMELSHVWVSSEWLPDIGLPQYAESFAGCLVDARLLDHLSKKDLEKYLGVTRKFHMAAIAHGVHLLRIVGYNRLALAERRRNCDSDPLVWTNQHFIQWARSIDLGEYAENLKGSGIHGAICVLEPSFNGDTLASAMGIPPSKQIIRRHLAAEIDALLNPARAKITQQYRMTKSRLPTPQRSDSLGRNAVPPTSLDSLETFRRSSGGEDSRRRTSLRGSLSRALGLKIKQDLTRRRGSREDGNSNNKAPEIPPHRTQDDQLAGLQFHSSRIQSLLGKFGGDALIGGSMGQVNNDYSPRDRDGYKTLQARPQSVMAMTTAPPPPPPMRNKHSDVHKSKETEINDKDDDEGTTPIAETEDESILTREHRRVKSIGDINHLPVHTPV